MGQPGKIQLPDFESLNRKLDAAIDLAFSKVRTVENSTAELREQMEREAENLTDYQVELMREEILAHERTPEWQQVIDRIALGELTWRQIVASYYTRRMEPDVKLAFDSLLNVPNLTIEQRQAIKAAVRQKFAQPEPEDEHAPGPGATSSDLGPEQDESGRAPREEREHQRDDDDDDAVWEGIEWE